VTLTGVEPAAFWRHFEAITKIPRPSHGEGPMIEHVLGWAEEQGHEARSDAAGNVVISVPATSGRESAPTLVLQGHLDMVCERRPDSPNDPAEGRIVLRRDGDWLTADGTTLGADNGVAIAAMLALVENESLPHGPLELLMTVAEEVGLEGASVLDGALLSGRQLLNLDSGADGCLTVGCAGSTDTWIRLTAPRGPVDGEAATLAVTVSGGLGGHSGVEIALGRSNAIKVLGQVLRETLADVPFCLVALDGGRSRNAIPRDAVAVCSVAAAGEAAFRTAVERSAATIRDAYANTDPDVAVRVTAAAAARDAWTAEATAGLLDAVALVPAGLLAMSPDFEGLVETSSSLGEALSDGDELTLHSLTRSSNDAALPGLIGTLGAIARLTGGMLDVKHNHGGWLSDLGSPLLADTKRVYERLFGEPPVVTAVHGGLEPAVIGGRVGGMDMVSFGPQIERAHSPDERLDVTTVPRFFGLLAGVVDEVSRTR
jgi:dipeptidase D